MPRWSDVDEDRAEQGRKEGLKEKGSLREREKSKER